MPSSIPTAVLRELGSSAGDSWSRVERKASSRTGIVTECNGLSTVRHKCCCERRAAPLHLGCWRPDQPPSDRNTAEDVVIPASSVVLPFPGQGTVLANRQAGSAPSLASLVMSLQDVYGRVRGAVVGESARLLAKTLMGPCRTAAGGPSEDTPFASSRRRK